MTARSDYISPSNSVRQARIVVASSGLGHVARGIEAWAADLGGALYRRGLDVTLCKGGGQAVAPHERVIPCWKRDSVAAKRLARGHLTVVDATNVRNELISCTCRIPSLR